MAQMAGLRWHDWLLSVGQNGCFYSSANTVLKMIREMGIRFGIRLETACHRYNSYRGVAGRTFGNVFARDFDAGTP